MLNMALNRNTLAWVFAVLVVLVALASQISIGYVPLKDRDPYGLSDSQAQAEAQKDLANGKQKVFVFYGGMLLREAPVVNKQHLGLVAGLPHERFGSRSDAISMEDKIRTEYAMVYNTAVAEALEQDGLSIKQPKPTP